LLEKAESTADPWARLSQRLGRKTVELERHISAAELATEIAKYKKAGFQRTGVGVWCVDKRDRDKTKIREVRFFSCKEDPSAYHERIVLDGIHFRKIFHAAASQRRAIARLGEAAAGGGSISRSYRALLVKAIRSGDKRAASHWAKKVAGSILRTKEGRHWLLEDGRTPLAVREPARRQYEQLYAHDVRRLGRKKADEKWRNEQALDFKQQTASDKIAVQLAMGWLSLPGGFPGYCFVSDEVTANLLGLFMPFLKSTKWKLVSTIRERIGLKKATIFVTCLKPLANGDWAAKDSRGLCWGLLKPL
jgi:hypothetical protein